MAVFRRIACEINCSDYGCSVNEFRTRSKILIALLFEYAIQCERETQVGPYSASIESSLVLMCGERNVALACDIISQSESALS